MDAVQIFVEGSGDVLFLKQLQTHMEPRLKGCWRKCCESRQDPSIDETQFQIPTLTFRCEWNGRMLVMRAMNGVSNVFPMPEPFLTSFGYSVDVDGLKIVKNVFVVDADDTHRGNGTGGIVEARVKFEVERRKCGSAGVGFAGFAMPDNNSDGTLEDILKDMIPSANRTVVDVCWGRFVACARSNGASFDPPLKSLIDVYAKMFNREAHGGIFASSSFKDHDTWDWDAPVLTELKAFLNREVLL